MTRSTEHKLSPSDQASRRAFLDVARKAVLAAPAVALLLNASSAMASYNCGKGNGTNDGTPGNSNCNDNTG
jgi:hypothetical protein